MLEVFLQVASWDPANISVGARRHPVGERERLRVEPTEKLGGEKNRRIYYDRNTGVKTICWDNRHINYRLLIFKL